MNKPRYFENLDGLRFICFLSVFFYHSFATDSDLIKNSFTYKFVKLDIFGNGNLGVNFFFVLSGFLITYLLIQEKKNNGRINIKHFYIRRSLRIWPLFYFCLLFGFILFPIIKTLFNQLPSETANPLYYITFLNNFDIINSGPPDSSILSVLWSVAIEEQFYLVWPLVLMIFPIKKFWIPFVSVLLLSVTFRYYTDDSILNEIHTVSCIGDMAVGAIGAWLILEFKKVELIFQHLSRYYIILIYFLVFIVFFFRIELLNSNIIVRVFERIIIATIFLSVILEQNYSQNSLFKLSNNKMMTKLGKISYGLYCLHFVGILISITITNRIFIKQNIWQVMVLNTFIALVLTVFFSKISYRYFEQPFLRIKKNFENKYA